MNGIQVFTSITQDIKSMTQAKEGRVACPINPIREKSIFITKDDPSIQEIRKTHSKRENGGVFQERKVILGRKLSTKGRNGL